MRLYFDRIILCLAFILASFLPASALTPNALENRVWEIFSIGYDAPSCALGGEIIAASRPAGAMLSFTGNLKIYVAVEPCEMRKGYEGLATLVTTALHQDLQGGALFVFGNRRRNRLKMLYFDGTGIWLMTKRLEEGTFSWPQGGEKVMALRPEASSMLTDGVDLRGGKLRPWYEREGRENTSVKVEV